MPRADRYRLDLRPGARRTLSEGPPAGLPLGVALAVTEFVLGPLLDDPRRVGKPLDPPFAGQHVARCGPDHRVRYLIEESTRTVVVVDVARRADAYGGER